METRTLGHSGLKVSLVGLGCNNFGGRLDVPATRQVVDRAIERGITFFDTADSYGNRGGSETQLGEVLGERRKDIVLATKFGSAMDDAGRLKGTSRGYIVGAVEASLRRLRTDWIDLYQLHWPEAGTPMEETLRALDDLVRSGKVRYIGCSNLPAWEVVDARWVSRVHGLAPFVCSQNEYSLLVRGHERELIPALRSQGMGLLPYYPLASGLLTGKYRKDQPLPEGTRLKNTKSWADRFLTAQNWDRVERVAQLCEARGVSMVEAAFGWLASKPVVSSIIAGATRPEQIDANVAAAAWRPDAEMLAALDAIAPPASA